MDKQKAKQRIAELRQQVEYHAKDIMMMIALKFQILSMIC